MCKQFFLKVIVSHINIDIKKIVKLISIKLL